jgi:hypothetical protein
MRLTFAADICSNNSQQNHCQLKPAKLLTFAAVFKTGCGPRQGRGLSRLKAVQLRPVSRGSRPAFWQFRWRDRARRTRCVAQRRTASHNFSF